MSSPLASRRGRAFCSWPPHYWDRRSAPASLSVERSRAERIRGDDDPILIPRWVASGSFPLDARDISDLDPESTGSVKKQARRPRPRCDTLVWFPDREPGDDLQEAC